MMLREVVLLQLLWMVVLVVVSTVGTVRDGCFAGNWGSLGRDGGVALLLLSWSSIVACNWIHGRVALYWTWKEAGQDSKAHG